MQSNRMTKLLNKIERKLGTKQLNLPDYLQKTAWADEVIAEDTLDTFSRYFPNKMTVVLQRSQRGKDGYYLIDEFIGDDIEIIGVRDIDWKQLKNSPYDDYGFHSSGFYAAGYGTDDIALLQARADQTSMVSNIVIPDFLPPNRIKLITTSGTDISGSIESYPLTIFIKHATNLMTIEPTKMEVFERLARADVAGFLYQNLKYYDGLETVHAQVDLKLQDLADEAGKRDDIIEELKEGYISAANKNQPMMITV